MATTSESKLFTPIQIGPIQLTHRVVMAPLTRSRSEQPGDIPGKLMLEYYTQRASDGGLIISEATTISVTGRGWLGAPGLYSDQQIEGWSRIVKAVHALPVDGFNRHHIGPSTSPRFQASSRTTAKRLLAPRQQTSMGWNSTPATGICLTSFFKTVAISALTPMAVLLRTDRDCC